VHIPNSPLKSTTELLFLPTTTAFHTTTGRSWLVDFWNLEVKWIFVALPIGILLTMLFYYDHVSMSPYRFQNFFCSLFFLVRTSVV